MAQPLGSPAAFASPAPCGSADGRQAVFSAAKKKGCKQKKCSNWKGDRCRCGRD